jgi:hypothetical protein
VSGSTTPKPIKKPGSDKKPAAIDIKEADQNGHEEPEVVSHFENGHGEPQENGHAVINGHSDTNGHAELIQE